VSDHPDSEEFVVTIRVLPARTPAAIRLRQWLKIGLRALGLKATRVEEVAADETGQEEE
jgi:hypothetical protein